eukprot:snap_masked-scaffold_5-processed-gene-18.43-mRNA-1 protein AED:1.00 eAED:1.00 QI:0/-1/0/0/-1/1/1/0/265
MMSYLISWYSYLFWKIINLGYYSFILGLVFSFFRKVVFLRTLAKNFVQPTKGFIGNVGVHMFQDRYSDPTMKTLEILEPKLGLSLTSPNHILHVDCKTAHVAQYFVSRVGLESQISIKGIDTNENFLNVGKIFIDKIKEENKFSPVKINVSLDAMTPEKVSNEKFEFVFLTNQLEYYSANELKKLLQHIKSFLTKNGKLVLIQSEAWDKESDDSLLEMMVTLRLVNKKLSLFNKHLLLVLKKEGFLVDEFSEKDGYLIASTQTVG